MPSGGFLEPEVLSTPEAFDEYPAEQRQTHFIRRTKEEMVYLDGRPLYPKRISDTLGYDLTQGEISEQTLYDETTEYLRFVYNKAKLLNREAARLAMSVFQRRLASSTYALLRSFERRIEKLDRLIEDVQDGKTHRRTTRHSFSSASMRKTTFWTPKPPMMRRPRKAGKKTRLAEESSSRVWSLPRWPISWPRRSKSRSSSIWPRRFTMRAMNPSSRSFGKS